MALDQMVVEVLHRPADIACAVHLQNPRRLIDRHPVRARLAQPPVEQAGEPSLLEPHPLAPERPFRHPKPFRRLDRAQSAAAEPIVDLLEPQHADLL